VTTIKSLIGQTLGQYQIIEQIGEGGMATVYKAYQAGLNRHVAIKVLPPYIAEKEGFVERFTREAQAIGNLHHPNILPVHDTGKDKGYGYIVMRYIPNAKTLADLMKQSLEREQIFHLTQQIAEALDHAHQAGIVHRDVKPSNILIDEEWVLLSDFGLAKMIEQPSEITGTGVGIGTPAYMSPEQAQGKQVDHRTDIYSLGIIMFEMLTGQVPHKAETPLAMVMKRINEPLPSPRNLNPDITEAAEAVLLKALAVEPRQRFNSAKALVNALQEAFTHKPGQFSKSDHQGTILSTPMPSPQTGPQTARPTPVEHDYSPSHTALVIQSALSTILGVIGLCSLGGILMSLIPDAATGQISLGAFFGFLGMVFASLSSIAMIWFRNKSRPASAWLALGILFWFIGINILGWGISAAMTPGNSTFAQNLGWSIFFCFAPGGFLTLLGAIFYGYDYRQRQRALAQRQAAALTEQARSRANKLRRANEYQTHIANLLKQNKGSFLADQLTPIITKLSQWEIHLRQLVNRLNDFETNQIIQRDIREVPTAIERLEAQLKTETDPQIRTQMEETLAGYREHLRQLDSLAAMLRRTELEIDETLAEIGTIYSQLQLLDAKDIDSKRASRLSEDIEEQANRLSDLLDAMDEVYESSAELG
jgi:serine/threonine protein kinase